MYTSAGLGRPKGTAVTLVARTEAPTRVVVAWAVGAQIVVASARGTSVAVVRAAEASLVHPRPQATRSVGAAITAP